MRRLINGIIWLVGLVVILGVYFFVPVGRFTLYEHSLRIAATEPAQELGDDLVRTGEAVGAEASRRWDERAAAREEAASAGGSTSGPTDRRFP